MWMAGGLGVVVRINGGSAGGDRPAMLMDAPDSPRSTPVRVTLPSVDEEDVPDVADAVMTRYAAKVIHEECRTVERSMIPALAWCRMVWRCEPLHRILSHAEYDPMVGALHWLDMVKGRRRVSARTSRIQAVKDARTVRRDGLESHANASGRRMTSMIRPTC